MCNPINYDKIKASVEEDPRLSICKRAQFLAIKQTFFYKINWKKLNLKSFKGKKPQKINEQDKSQRLEMANAFRKEMNKDSNWINNIWFSDEAYFYLDNRINSQSSRT